MYKYYACFVVCIIAATIAIFLSSYVLSATLLLISLVPVVYAEIKVFATKYEINEYAIIERFEFISENEKIVPLERIQDIKISMDPIERLFDVGQLKVNTAGSPSYEIVMIAVPNPKEKLDLIMKYRSRVNSDTPEP